MIMTGTSPSFASMLTGDFVYTITFEFSGMRAPDITSLAHLAQPNTHFAQP